MQPLRSPRPRRHLQPSVSPAAAVSRGDLRGGTWSRDPGSPEGARTGPSARRRRRQVEAHRGRGRSCETGSVFLSASLSLGPVLVTRGRSEVAVLPREPPRTPALQFLGCRLAETACTRPAAPISGGRKIPPDKAGGGVCFIFPGRCPPGLLRPWHSHWPRDSANGPSRGATAGPPERLGPRETGGQAWGSEVGGDQGDQRGLLRPPWRDMGLGGLSWGVPRPCFLLEGRGELAVRPRPVPGVLAPRGRGRGRGGAGGNGEPNSGRVGV